MIHIKQYFAGRTADCFADHKGLVGMAEKQVGVIAQRFQDHYKSMRFENTGRFSQRRNNICGLIFKRQTAFVIAGNNCSPFSITAFGNFYRFFA